MGRTKNTIPSYLLHKSSGQARVRISGRDYLLGPFGSDESRIEYGKLISRHVSGLPPIDPMAKSRRPADPSEESDPGPSVAEVIVAFRAHAKKHYVKNGVPTSEIHCIESCMRILRGLYGLTPAKDFGPLALKAVREKMVEGDPDAMDAECNPCPRKPWGRKTVNRMVGRIRQCFRLAVENEMVDSTVLTRLQSVSPLLAGRTEAKDYPRRQAVDQDRIDAVRAIVSPLVRDLIDLQLLTGARSSELLALNSRMIDRTGDVWKAELEDHKCVHHGQRRVLHFGPQAKLILAKRLSSDGDRPLFNIIREAYCRAVTRACEKAGIDRWTPHWLRHTYCTRIREKYGIDAAQAVVGHSTADMTDQYSSKMEKLAAQTVAAAG